MIINGTSVANIKGQFLTALDEVNNEETTFKTTIADLESAGNVDNLAKEKEKRSQGDMRALNRAAEYKSHKHKSKSDPSTLRVDKKLPNYVGSVSQLPCEKHSKVNCRVEGCKSTNNPRIVEG